MQSFVLSTIAPHQSNGMSQA